MADSKSKKVNVHKGHRQRVKQKIAEHGIDVLHDHEILEYLLYPFIPLKDTNPIAHSLLNTFGNLYTLINTDAEAIFSVPHVTKDAALFLSSLSGVFKRCSRINAGNKKVFIRNVSDAASYLHSVTRGLDVEVIYMLCVDDACLMRAGYLMNSGDATGCKTEIRSYLRKLDTVNASHVYVGHNHTVGTPMPSEEDNIFTRKLNTALDSIGVTLADHLVLTDDGRYFSYRLNGLLEDTL
ncbi:MAG: hypothetical protein K2M44_04105 [Clostridia bacterium]|nr:hypothetical protein [Clostridia bacterium]